MGMVSKSEILMGRDKVYPSAYTDEISENIHKLLIPINKVRDAYGKPMYVASGWRPPQINDSTSNAAKKSNHLLGLAVDIKDHDGSLWKWCLAHMDLMKELGLWFEDPRWTPTWVHFQIVPPKSGRRIYRPSMADALAPDRWDGRLDPSWN